MIDPAAAPATTALREAALAEKTKEREFYRYYHHATRPSTVIGDHPHDHSPPEFSVPPPGPVESPFPCDDKALTAFAQLGALRLHARRGLISFFDRRNCYVLAEATPTLSLQTGVAVSDDDALQWGRCVFPKHESICYYTVNLPPLEHLAAGINDQYSNVPSLVVNDLSKDERFKNYPSVIGPAHSRFYAGVPIRSPSGHNIGTYCVLDEKPRDGISDVDMLFLKDMAITVMRHLEMTRAVDEHRRGGIMVRSLGSFAEGKSNLDDWWPEPWGLESGSPDGPMDEIPIPRHRRRTTTSSAGGPPLEFRDPMDASHAEAFLSTSPSLKSPSSSLKSPNVVTPDTQPTGSDVITPASDVLSDTRRNPAVPTKTSSSTKDDADKYKLSPEVKTLFSRAAKMIREATEADGAIFFDAKVSTFGGLVDDEFVQEQQTELTDQDKPCAILGASTSEVRSGHFMSESLLRHLLRTYPHGQIFNFDDENEWGIPTPQETENPPLTVSETLAKISPVIPIRRPDSSKSQDDENLLKEAFPTARSLVLYPLWDSHRDRWFAGAIVWSPDPMRVFSNEQELSYLAAFSNSIMAEVARLDIKLADAAKGDFISSISHELRSPLHGILGCCELLKDSTLNNFQSNMAQTIETCGKTLLDTINHVLDFAKINSLTTGNAKRQNRRSQSTRQIISPAQSHTNDIMTLITDVDLCVLTEEVLETVFAGYNFQRNATSQVYGAPSSIQSDMPHLSVIVDINKSDNYVFRTQPGAWRRVLMNLFGNALKYTPSGYTKVKLQVIPGNDPHEGLSEFRLIVTDSGIGMSEDYVHNRLFHSFAQENPLSQGTGLGLSIVKQIVESLGGDIEVRSQKHHGTKFTITCPLKMSMLSPADPIAHSDKELLAIKKRTQGLNVAFVGFETESEYFPVKSYKNRNATLLTLNALQTACTDWFGMNVVPYASTDSSPVADVFVASEAGARAVRAEYSTKGEKYPTAPVIVLCQGAASAHTTTAITDPGQTFECISQPCGPHKLAKALESSLDRHANRVMALCEVTDNVFPAVERLTLKQNTPPMSPTEIANALTPVDIPILDRRLEDVRPPLTPFLSAPAVRSASRAKENLRPATPRPLNCLAADDNPINLRLLRCFIEKLHHKHSLAINGLEALARYKSASAEERFDVVLMDINMPEMDGLEATRQIRAYERDAGLKPTTIIALTGVASSEAQQEAHVSGVNLFLIKPVRLGELETVLKGVVIGDDTPKTITEMSHDHKDDTKGGAVKGSIGNSNSIGNGNGNGSGKAATGGR